MSLFRLALMIKAESIPYNFGMAESSFLKRNWKLLLNIITFIALVVLVYAIRHQLSQTVRALASVNLWIILLMLLFQLGNYHAQSKLYQSLFRTVNEQL